jgi:hypothetical protein
MLCIHIHTHTHHPAIMFFGIWVMLSEFGNMFFVQEEVVKQTGKEDTQLWAGYCMSWGALFIANVVIANKLWAHETLATKAPAQRHRSTLRRSRVGPEPGEVAPAAEEEHIPDHDNVVTVFG